MAREVCLKVGGKAFSLRPSSPNMEKVTSYLDKSPVDELFTMAMVEKALGLDDQTIRRAIADRKADYCHQIGRICYYGNPKAIAELRRQVNA